MLFGVSKQAYYKYDDNVALSKSASEEFALQYIRGVRENHDPGIGGVKCGTCTVKNLKVITQWEETAF